MVKHLSKIIFIFFILGLTGCAGLGNMKKVKFSNEVEPDVALVNIVRRSVFMGDGAKVEMWDGDKFIGTLSAGTLLQYKTQPGLHTFMTYVQGSWGVATGELKPGKTYYLKFNLPTFGANSLGVAQADDPRIAEWNTMTTVVLDESSTKAVPEKYIKKARETLKKAEKGEIPMAVITDASAL